MGRSATTFLLLAALLVVGCGTTGIYEPGPIAPPVAPPIIPPPPVGPVTPPDPAPVDPSEPVLVSDGMTKADVVAALGRPVGDPPENPGMPDWAYWAVMVDAQTRALWIRFTDGRVDRQQYRDTVDVR